MTTKPSFTKKLHQRGITGKKVSIPETKEMLYGRILPIQEKYNRLQTAQMEAYFGTGTLAQAEAMQKQLNEMAIPMTKYRQAIEDLRAEEFTRYDTGGNPV